MGNTSKGKSQTTGSTISVEALRDSLGGLKNSLKTLTDAVNKVNDDIKALSFLSETVTISSDAAPEPASKEEKRGAKKAVETTAVEPTRALSPQEALLEAVNTLPIPDLIDKLKGGPAKQNVIKNIISERKKLTFQRFTSLDDLVTRVKGLAKPSLDKILEQWS